MKRLFLLLPLLALAAAPARGADEPATNAVDAAGEFAPFTIKDAVARARAYEAKFSDPHVQPDITFYMISRCRDEKGEFWKFEYSPRRNNTWPDLELVVRPDGDVVESEKKRESGFNFVSESSLFRYCEAVGIDLATVTAFEPEPEQPGPDWEDEPPEPPEPPDSIDLQDVDSFPDDVYGIICWTNAPIRVTDSLLFEVETNHFATLIAQADKIVVRSGGYVCCTTNVDNQPILATITNATEIAEFNAMLRFHRRYPYLSNCLCCGYPGVDWWIGERKIVLSSVQHCQALRWKGFSGDMPFIKESSEELEKWLIGHGVKIR